MTKRRSVNMEDRRSYLVHLYVDDRWEASTPPNEMVPGLSQQEMAEMLHRTRLVVRNIKQATERVTD